MKHFDCPVIGNRPISEFTGGGTAINGLLNADPASARANLNFGDGTVKIKHEWWYHRPSQLWFIVARDTGSDSVLSVQLAGNEVQHAGA